MAAIAKGPVSVSISTNAVAIKRYQEGVIIADCDTDINHSMLAVGFGTTDDGTPYYKLKNSWGADWGESGYVRIAITPGDGMCGI